jgi:hypothetical protein
VNRSRRNERKVFLLQRAFIDGDRNRIAIFICERHLPFARKCRVIVEDRAETEGIVDRGVHRSGKDSPKTYRSLRR